MNKIIEFSLKNRIIILLFYVLIILYGLSAIKKMSVDVFPDLNRPQVSLIVEAGGLAPEELESQVIIPIENAINGASKISRIFSSANIGYGIIKAEFDWDTDVYQARQIITEKLSQLDNFNNQVKISMAPISSIMGEILIVGISSPSGELDSMALRDLAQWHLKKRLQSISGVSQVSIIGGDEKQYQVLIDPNQLRLNNITLDTVRTALQSSGQNTNGGLLIENYTEKLVRNFGLVKNEEDIKNSVLPIKMNGMSPALSIENVAEVVVAPAINKRGDASINGVSAVLLSIAKQPNADTLSLTNKIEAELEIIEKTLPQGVELHNALFKQANFINKAVDNIRSSIEVGSLLVALVLFAFLLNFRTTAIVLVVIPVSFIMTAIVFKFFNMSINTMTLGGLAMAIGSLVDDAIVAVANIFKRIKENKDKPIFDVVYKALAEVINSIVYSTVLVFLVFIPLFALGGIEGKIFSPLALAFIISMVASMVVSVTLTPVLSYYMLPSLKILKNPDGMVVRSLKKIHKKSLEFCFVRYRLVFGASIALFAVAVICLFGFGKEFLPPFNEGSFNIGITMPSSTSLEESSRIRNIAQKKLLEIPEVFSASGRSGRTDVDEHALGVNMTELEVELKEDISRSTLDVMEDIRNKLKFPGVFVNVGQPISHRIDFIISGIRSQIAVKVFGQDLQVLQDLSSQITSAMAEVDGVIDINAEQQNFVPQVNIEVDRKMAKQYGVMVGDVSTDIQTSLAGEVVSQLIFGDRFYDLVFRINDGSKVNLEALGNIPVETINDYFVPLKAIANIQEGQTPSQISRENAMRRIVISANFTGSDLVGAVNKIREHIKSDIIFPEGYFYSFDGQFETRAQATKEIASLGVLALVLVFVGLYLNFRSVNLVVQLMAVVSLSLVGAVIGIAFSSQTISIASIIGFIALLGIAIRNGILLLDLYESQDKKLTIDELVFLTSERLTPVLMTSITSILAFLPLIIGGNTAGKEILYPVAIVIAFGLISSTIANLLITPVLYYKNTPKD